MRPSTMRHRIAGWLFVAPVLAGPSLLAQVSLHIGPASTLEVTGSIDLELSGNWINQGMFNPGSGTVTFNGASGTQDINNATPATFNNLRVNKPAGEVMNHSQIVVNGSLVLTDGTLHLGGYPLELGPAATLTESAGNTVNSGIIWATRTLTGPNGVNVGGLGFVITSAADLGETTINRRWFPFSSGSNQGIRRSYTVIPTNNAGLDATIVFTYDDSELGDLVESELTLFCTTDDGTTWTMMGGALDTDQNTLTLSGVDHLSTWTAGSVSSPLPVQITSLSAEVNRFATVLRWSTATEVQNEGFQIERRFMTPDLSAAEWSVVGFAEGKGTSTAPIEYTFHDRVTRAGRYAYRLKQIDRDGSFQYSQEVEIVVLAPTAFALHHNYPNPFNPSTTIEYELPEELPVRLAVYDNLGREVKILVDGIQQPGYYRAIFDAVGYASGLYYCRLETKEQTHVARMLLMK